MKRTEDYWMSGQMENGQIEIEFFQHGLLMVEMICQQMLHVEPNAVLYGLSNTNNSSNKIVMSYL